MWNYEGQGQRISMTPKFYMSATELAISMRDFPLGLDSEKDCQYYTFFFLLKMPAKLKSE